jgi:hypothetical protein
MTTAASRRWSAVVGLLLWSGAAGAGAGAGSVAVLPLAGGADGATRAAWTQSLRGAVGTVDDFTALPAATVNDALVTADALGNACAPVEPSCIAHLGALSTAAYAIGGHVDGSRDGVTLIVDVVDVGRARSVRRVVFSSSSAPTEDAVRLLAVRLLAPRLERAFVVVRGALPGAVISIDGEVRGTTPLPGPIEIRPGRHEVVIDHVERDAFVRAVDVALGATAVVEVADRDVDRFTDRSTDRFADAAAGRTPPSGQVPGEQAVVDGSPAARRGLRVVVVAPSSVDGLPSEVGERFAERVRAVLRQIDGVELVRGPRDDIEEVRAALDQLTGQVLDQQTSVVVDDDAARLAHVRDVDLRIVLRLDRLGQTVQFGARGISPRSAEARSFVETARVDDLDDALARRAFPLVAAMLDGADVGLLPSGERRGLPRWVMTTTLVAGGLGAVATGVTGGLWLAGDARDEALGIACGASVALTGALAVAAAVEAPFLE